MPQTTPFREQHSEMERLIRQITDQFDPVRLANGPIAVRAQLVQLTEIWKMHLTMEEECLYPPLLRNADRRVRALARRFHKEMTGLSRKVEAYAGKWSTPKSIQSRPETFVRESRELFDALNQRIRRENTELFAVAGDAA